MARVTFDETLTVSDESVVQGTAQTLNVTGAGASVAVTSGVATLTIPGGAAIQRTGEALGQATTINFVGAGVSVTVVAGVATVTVA